MKYLQVFPGHRYENVKLFLISTNLNYKKNKLIKFPYS